MRSTSTLCPGKASWSHKVEECSKTTPQDRWKRNWWLQQRTTEHAERRASAPSDPKPHIDVMSAIRTAFPTLAFSTTSDATTTQQEINTRQKTKTLGCIIHGHLWPTEAWPMCIVWSDFSKTIAWSARVPRGQNRRRIRSKNTLHGKRA